MRPSLEGIGPPRGLHSHKNGTEYCDTLSAASHQCARSNQSCPGQQTQDRSNLGTMQNPQSSHCSVSSRLSSDPSNQPAPLQPPHPAWPTKPITPLAVGTMHQTFPPVRCAQTYLRLMRDTWPISAIALDSQASSGCGPCSKSRSAACSTHSQAGVSQHPAPPSQP